MTKKDKFKNFLKKAKFIITKYWYLFLAAIVGLVMVVFLKNDPNNSLYGSLMAKYRKLMEENADDLQQASDIREQEQKDQDELNRNYVKVVESLKEKHRLEVESITQEQENTIKEILASTDNSPELMADKLSQTLGLPVVPRVETQEDVK